MRTKITHLKDDKEIVHGVDLQQLVREKTFGAAIFFLLTGKEGNQKQVQMFEALLVSAIDHGAGTPSAFVSRVVASAKSEMNASVAAGLLTMGDRHGAATGNAMTFFYKHVDESDVASLVSRLKEQRIRIPGYGHAQLDHDHRADTLFTIARETGLFGRYCEFAHVVHKELNAISSKHLPLNVDAAIGAILCEMGFDAALGKGVFMIARMPGLVAHVREQQTNDDGLKRLSEDNIEYLEV